ncbi:anhydro-N-acetylmuramic acid kinase [Egbenema bharatensis]|uniref:anhydro-N-acetylmuramic acid kinase n=1 Tax=Egbenema bharatensis TaxID=3463334 RepID=UPI003A8ACF0C
MNVIGLISGTSVDGIDAALVSISGSTTDLSVDLIAADTYPYPEQLRSQILSVCGGAPLAMVDLATLDDAIAHHFAQAALTLQSKFPAVDLIGSHGQTVYHRPPTPDSLGYSLQLGRGSLIAHLTHLPTVSNFRAADIAVGGQGAPLVSPIDVCLLSHPTYHRCIQNLGGIGNLTYLPPIGNSREPDQDFPPNSSPSWAAPASRLPNSAAIQGWDTGPGNALLDLAVYRLSQGQQTFDQDGTWAAQGTPCLALVEQWLQQDYFQQPPPKSTGRELFSADYLDRCLQDAAAYSLSAADILATLTELTAASIAHSYQTFLPQMPDQVLLCGGGSRNPYLRQRIQANLPSTTVHTTDEMGLSADFKEAISFAVLAYWRYCNIPGNLPEVTGARRSMLLGEIHLVT